MAKLLTLSQFSTSMNSFAAKCDARFMKKGEGGNYTIKQQASAESGYFSTYQLFNVVGEGAEATETAVGAKINIPKDFLVKSASVEVVSQADTPYDGAKVGDKYIDFVVNTIDASETATHIYLPVNDLVDVYTGGNGIAVSANNEITLTVDSTNANGLAVTANGLKLDPVVASASGVGGSNGAMTAAQAEKLAGLENATAGNGIDITNHEVSVQVDSTNARGLSTSANGLSLALVTPDTYSGDTKTADGTAGAMSSADKYKLDSLVEATDQEVAAVIAAIWAD